MNAVQILDDLTQRGVRIWVEDEKLRLRSPAGVLDERDRQLLSQHKAQLLDLLGRRPGQPSRLEVVPRPQDRHQPFPLTDIQQAYWIGRQEAFDLGDVAIHFYTEVDCEDLDVERLTAAWNRLVERHGMLRAIVHEDGQQQILAEVPRYEIATLDLRHLDPEARRDRLEELREALSHRVPSAAEWPSFDLRLTRLDECRTRLHFSLDLLHIDGASILILCSDLTRLYQDPETELPPLELSYRDYALAEHAVVELPEFARGLEFWRQRVKELPPAPELPLAIAPSQLERTRFVRHVLEVSPEVYNRLKKSAAGLGLTPTAFFLSAFGETLRAYNKGPDLTLNVTLFNRLQVHEDVNRLVGDFTSMVLLGDRVIGEETLLERARRRQQELWEALEHRYVSGVKVLGELNKINSSSSGGAMPVVFTSLLDLKSQGFDPDVLSAFGEEVYTITQTPQVYLDHQVREARDGGIILSWDVVEELFPPGLVQDIFAAYHRLLHRLVDDEDLWHQRGVDVLTSGERELRRRVNDTAAPLPEETLYTLFLARVEADPEATAVIAQDRTLSYRELHQEVQALGHRLRQLGARPDTQVAIAMEKGWEQVVGAVAVHAAGAAYLPLDPALPEERRRYLLEAGEVRIVLTQSWIDAALEWPDNVIRLAVDKEAGAADGGADLEPVQQPHHLSHVIYTSGSTGLPKGVMVEHRSVVNRMLDIVERFEIGPADRALALTALHHDLSVFDIFGVLAAGAAMVIPEDARRRDPGHWLELMEEHRVTLWNSVPAFLEMLMEYVEAEGETKTVPPSLRWVIMAGDWIPVSLPDRLRAQVPAVDFIASGGPTETCIWDIWNRVEKVDPSWSSIPYGKPLKNATYHVLDHALFDRPTWVPGEMYIGGAGLARGYWKDEEKTEQKFIVHSRTGERLYRSGDWGRYLPDGTLEFIGREDFQVKIRGQRIELGEIEAAIKAHPQVRTTVASVVDDQRGRRLVAYVVPAQGAVELADRPAAPASGPAPAGDGLAAGNDDEAAGVEISDPIERTQFKLRYTALRPQDPGRRSIALPAVDRDELASRLELGRSHRQWSSREIELERFGRFLSDLAFVDQGGLHKYRYASGGGLYPVQVYLHVAPGRVAGLDGGVYYFHPGEHRLEQLSEADLDPAIHYAANRAMAAAAAFQIFLVADLDAVRPMYGDLATSFCLLEAGMISQVLRESADRTGIGVCQVGSVRFDEIRPHFCLEDRHLFLHALLGGALPEAGEAGEPAGGGGSSSPAGSAVERGVFEQDLRAFLRRKLPEHMVPSALVLLPEMPLTANGKVDRRSLAELEIESSPADYAPPGNELEAQLAELWQQALGIDAIGVNSNFFDLGANSTLVVRVYRQLRERLGIDFPLITMFRRPTIHSLAEFLSQGETAERDDFSRSESRAEARLKRMKKRRGRRR